MTLDFDVTAGVSSNKPILDPSCDTVSTQMVRHSQSKVSRRHQIRRTSSTGGQNTSQSCTMMTEAHHLSSIMMKALMFLRRKFKRPSKR